MKVIAAIVIALVGFFSLVTAPLRAAPAGGLLGVKTGHSSQLDKVGFRGLPWIPWIP